jgi:hypothetical protein
MPYAGQSFIAGGPRQRDDGRPRSRGAGVGAACGEARRRDDGPGPVRRHRGADGRKASPSLLAHASRLPAAVGGSCAPRRGGVAKRQESLPPWRGRRPLSGHRERGVVQSSRGAPVMRSGSRRLLPVKRRMVARSTRRSTVATAVSSDGKRDFHLEKPVLAVITMEPC